MPGQLRFKLAIFIGAAGGIAFLCTSSFNGSRTPSSSINPHLASPAVSEEAETDGERYYLPEAGFRYSYAFRREINFESEFGAALPKVAFTGEFYADVLRANTRSFEAILSEKINGAPAPSRPLMRIEADARGNSLRVFTLSGLTETEKQHASVMKDLVAQWLFPLSSDTVGDFEARFESEPAEPGFAHEAKTKITYLSKAPNTPLILSSEHHLRWSLTRHMPEEVKGRETTRLGKGKTALTATNAYEMLFTAKGKSPAIDETALAALQERDTLALDTSHPNLAEHPDYANLDWGKLMADLKEAAHLSNSKQLSLFGDVMKYLRLHPEKSGDLAALLRDPALLKAGAASAEFRNIVGALATFATPEALSALRDAYAEPSLALPGKGMILSSLTTTQATLDIPTRDFLTHEMQGATDARLAQAAAFALGSSLQNAPNDNQSARAVAVIAENLASAQTVPAQLAALDVIGNSGRAEFQAALEAVIQGNAAPIVRARAVFALRFVATSGAANDLVTALSSPDVSVRESAANAIAGGNWREAFRAPLTLCSSQEGVARIQAVCQKVLSSNTQVASAK